MNPRKEYLPFIRRCEYTGYATKQTVAKEKYKPDTWYNRFMSLFKQNKVKGAWGEWRYYAVPTNGGGTRDIPHDATFHAAVVQRFLRFPTWKPKNDVFPSKSENEQDKKIYHLFQAGEYLNRALDDSKRHSVNASLLDPGPTFIRYVEDDQKGIKKDVHDYIFKLGFGTYSDWELDDLSKLVEED